MRVAPLALWTALAGCAAAVAPPAPAGSRSVVSGRAARAAVGAPQAPVPASAPPSGDPRMAFWSAPRAGANLFDRVPDPERFAAARQAGASFVRLVPNKWATTRRDFLLGDADAFERFVPEDLARLRAALDQAHAAGLRVVLSTLSLPGSRWRQQNGGVADTRLHEDPRQLERALAFWRELARALRDHPAIVAYDVLNEPIPDPTGSPEDAAALQRVDAALVAAIRAEDLEVPIVLECGRQASPDAFGALVPIDDPGLLYSFHMYEPYGYTNLRENGGRRHYPNPTQGLSREDLARLVEPVVRWQREHAIPSTRILLGELGVDRRVPGAARYLEDVLSIAQEQGWHWAFYSFREDTWPGMDYELGTRRLDAATWARIDAGEPVTLPRGPNPTFDVVASQLRRAAGLPLLDERVGAELHARVVAPRLYVITHERPFAANSLLAEMDDGTLFFAGSPYTPSATRAVLDWARARWGPRRRVAVATHFHYDAIGGAAAFARAGVEHWASDRTVRLLRELGRARRALMLSVLRDRPGEAAAFRGWLPRAPRRVFPLRDGLLLTFGREHVRVLFPGPGHSADNVVVHLPERRVLFGGCAVVSGERPGYVGDADLMRWPAAVDAMETLDADVVVPGHGDRLDRGLLANTRAAVARAVEAGPPAR